MHITFGFKHNKEIRAMQEKIREMMEAARGKDLAFIVESLANILGEPITPGRMWSIALWVQNYDKQSYWRGTLTEGGEEAAIDNLRQQTEEIAKEDFMTSHLVQANPNFVLPDHYKINLFFFGSDVDRAKKAITEILAKICSRENHLSFDIERFMVCKECQLRSASGNGLTLPAYCDSMMFTVKIMRRATYITSSFG